MKYPVQLSKQLPEDISTDTDIALTDDFKRTLITNLTHHIKDINGFTGELTESLQLNIILTVDSYCMDILKWAANKDVQINLPIWLSPANKEIILRSERNIYI